MVNEKMCVLLQMEMFFYFFVEFYCFFFLVKYLIGLLEKVDLELFGFIISQIFVVYIKKGKVSGI